MVRNRHRRLAALAAGVVIPVFALAACGSSSGGSGDSGSTGSGDKGSSAALDAAFKGDESAPPSTSPKPATGKTVYWLSCGEVTQSCASYTAAGKEAAEAIGWNFKVVDGNLNQANGYANAMRTAIAAKPDAIVQDAFSCAADQPQLQQAKKLGIPVIGVETVDCSDAKVGPKLFTIDMVYSEKYPTHAAWWTGWGEWAASFIAADSGGKAKIITAPGKGDPQFDFYNSGFDKTLTQKCSGCKVVDEVSWTVADLAANGPWVTGLRNSLVKNPDADYVWVPFDTNAVESGGAKAVLQAGGKAKLLSGIGSGSAMDLIREGQIAAESVARSSDWVSWAAIDQINRHFAGEKSVPQGLGFISIDKSHNLPDKKGEAYATSVDFRSLYKKAWGVE